MKLNAKVSKTTYEDEADKTSSAQIVASIEDLLIEILLRLPLKPLVRFKLVSKHWNFVISDKKFQYLRNQNPNPAVGLMFPEPYKWACPSWLSNAYVVSFDKSTNGPPLKSFKFISQWPSTILNSCNGLFLYKRQSYSEYSVNNPTTNKYFSLPKIDYIIDYTSRKQAGTRAYLAYDPSKSPHYKVVCVVALEERHHGDQFEVYSSQTGCWRTCGKPFQADVYYSHGVYWNGAIHWISDTNAIKSFYFNPDNDETLQVMPSPPTTPINSTDDDLAYSVQYSGESCGHLHCIEDYRTAMELNVYEMRRDYSEWFVKYRVDCSRIDGHVGSRLCALVRGRKDEDSFLVWRCEKRLIRHNVVDDTFQTLCECEGDEPEQSSLPLSSPLQYIESLCSL